MADNEKRCVCGRQLFKRKRDSVAQWEKRKFCSIECANKNKFECVDIGERFWRFVPSRVKNTCWHWAGSVDGGGYGTLAVGPGESPVKAHRMSWEIHFGQIPDGLVVCHACDNPACVNPHHLMLGTQMANTLDTSRKGRLNDSSLLNLRPGMRGIRGAGTQSVGERNVARNQ